MGSRTNVGFSNKVRPWDFPNLSLIHEAGVLLLAVVHQSGTRGENSNNPTLETSDIASDEKVSPEPTIG